MPQDLFSPVVSENKMHPSFKIMLDPNYYKGTKRLMNEYFDLMGDKDGNFVEQFQTRGFDARVFELALFAVLHNLNYDFDSTHNRPDFCIKANKDHPTLPGLELSIEAVTTNPRVAFQNTADLIEPISTDEIDEKYMNELPIRLGSSLYSKLQNNYHELEQCKDKPFILAIQAFHEPGSLLFTESGLAQYLYGKKFSVDESSGEPIVVEETIESHTIDGKTIPSALFRREEAKNLSGVIFSNQLTVSKFSRMAYQLGYNTEDISIIRQGHCFNPDPAAFLPSPYKYVLGEDAAIEESWEQGMTLIVNPCCEDPLPPTAFHDMSMYFEIDGEIGSSVFSFHPYTSISHIFYNKPVGQPKISHNPAKT